MNDPLSPDPASNPYSNMQGPEQPSTVSVRPTGATVVAVICLVFGLIGVLAGLLAVLQMVFAQQIADAMVPAGQAGDLQREMNEAMSSITSKYLIPNIIITVTSILISSSLVIGAFGILTRKVWAPSWMRKLFLAAIIFEVLRGIVYVFMQVDMLPVMQESMTKMTESSAPGNANMESMQTIQQMSLIIGIVFWGLWALMKIALMLWGRIYMGRQHVKDYFQAT